MTPGFLWILLCFGLYGGLHSLLASHTAKKLAVRWIGPRGKLFYRLFFVLISIVTFVPLLFMVAYLPDRGIYFIEHPYSLLTSLIQLFGLAIALVSLVQTGLARFLGMDLLLDWANNIDREPVFVTTGVYRWVRHPLYTGTLLFLWAFPFMSWNLLAFNLAATAYFLIGSRFEENKLVNDYGAAYVNYRTRTPPFLPDFRFFRK